MEWDELELFQFDGLVHIVKSLEKVESPQVVVGGYCIICLGC
jgi:hypothetical protein